MKSYSGGDTKVGIISQHFQIMKRLSDLELAKATLPKFLHMDRKVQKWLKVLEATVGSSGPRVPHQLLGLCSSYWFGFPWHHLPICRRRSSSDNRA